MTNPASTDNPNPAIRTTKNAALLTLATLLLGAAAPQLAVGISGNGAPPWFSLAEAALGVLAFALYEIAP